MSSLHLLVSLEVHQTHLVAHKHAFAWKMAPHPFAQRQLVASDGGHTFRSLAAGPLHALVADHVVHGRVIFPGAAYLELARAAASPGGAALRSVFFLQPLAVEPPEVIIECVVRCDGFEVRSGDSADALSASATTHCSGTLTAARASQRGDQAFAGRCGAPASVSSLYDGFDAGGLQYGPGYRTLLQAWGGGSGQASGAARLQPRSTHDGTLVHPADLDDALCAGLLAVADAGGGGDGTRLPFAVDDAQLDGARGALWAVGGTHSPQG